MTLVSEEMALEEGHGSDDSTFTASGIAVEFQLGRDHSCDVFCVCGGSCTAAVDVGSDEMNFFAIFVGHGGPRSGAGICTENNAILQVESLTDTLRFDALYRNNGMELSGIRREGCLP